MKFTIADFNKRFPDDNACIDEIFRIRFSGLKACPQCEKETKFHKISKRRCYACQWCGYQIYPTKGTIFEKSTTSLRHWLYAMYLMTATRSGVSAKELERQLGVTYKCAWRIAKQIRTLMGSKETNKLNGIVEIDDTYIGGIKRGKRGRGAKDKTVVFGLLERGGNVKAVQLDNLKKSTVEPIVDVAIERGAEIHSDEFLSYQTLASRGYKHSFVSHGKKEYVSGNTHIQSIEGFWSQLKRSISGTHVWVSKKHLQNYVDEFAFRYNLRGQPTSMFNSLLSRLIWPS